MEAVVTCKVKRIFIILLRVTGSISSIAVEDVFNFNKHETYTFNTFIL
jgi:hypothetical protein